MLRPVTAVLVHGLISSVRFDSRPELINSNPGAWHSTRCWTALQPLLEETCSTVAVALPSVVETDDESHDMCEDALAVRAAVNSALSAGQDVIIVAVRFCLYYRRREKLTDLTAAFLRVYTG